MSIMEKLNTIQCALRAPKGEHNAFGNYKYRSCESILEALKPHLHSTGSTVTMSDDVVAVGDRIYVKATATFRFGDQQVCVSAFAREAPNRKGMDESQITGSASSYARKYALCGLFAIDGNDDADALNTSPEYTASASDDIRKEWSARIAECESAAMINVAIADLGKLEISEDIKRDIKNLIMQTAKSLGFVWDKAQKKFTENAA